MSKPKNIGKQLLICQKDMVLIKESETAKDKEIYGNLYSVIQDMDKLSESDFTSSKLFDEKARAVILENRNLLIDNSASEWRNIGYYDCTDNKIPCQLCHTPNTHIYYIQNIHNGKELHVGSECRKKFPDKVNARLLRKDYKEHDKQRLIDKRTIEFSEIESLEPGFRENAANSIRNINILLSFDLLNAIKKMLYDINFIRTDYIKNGGDLQEVTDRYNSLKVEF